MTERTLYELRGGAKRALVDKLRSITKPVMYSLSACVVLALYLIIPTMVSLGQVVPGGWSQLLTALGLLVLGQVAVLNVLSRTAVRHKAGEGSKQGIFELGEQTLSEGVELLMKKIGTTPVMKCLKLHHVGDWGEVDEETCRLNVLSLRGSERYGFESAYTMEDGTGLRILTYEDYSSTLLLTEEECHQEGKIYVRPVMEYC